MELSGVDFLTGWTLKQRDALLVVDIQHDFLPEGPLAAQEGDQIIPGVNQLLEKVKAVQAPVIFTQDWHPANHLSFASQHAGKSPFDPFQGYGLGPVLWPDHCIQGTDGSQFPESLNTEAAETIIRKGYNREIDSYSGFLENDHQTETGLDGYLKGRGVQRLLVCGLAYDYCVFFTAADGADKNYQVVVLTDLTQPVGAPEGSIDRATRELKSKGVRFMHSNEVTASV